MLLLTFDKAHVNQAARSWFLRSATAAFAFVRTVSVLCVNDPPAALDPTSVWCNSTAGTLLV